MLLLFCWYDDVTIGHVINNTIFDNNFLLVNSNIHVPKGL